MVLLRNGAGFTCLKGNSKKSCHFTKKHMEIAPFFIERSMVLAFFFIVLTLFILLSWSQNKACVTLDQYFILALKNGVWSNRAVINFIGNHFEAYFWQVYIFFKILKNRNLAFLVLIFRKIDKNTKLIENINGKN